MLAANIASCASTPLQGDAAPTQAADPQATLIATIPLGMGSLESVDGAVSPDGTRLYVPCWVSDYETVIDTVTATIPTGEGPRMAAVSPDGMRVYITSSGSGEVTVIDIATNEVTATIPVGDWPRWAALSPDGRRLYVINENSADMSVIDTGR